MKNGKCGREPAISGNGETGLFLQIVSGTLTVADTVKNQTCALTAEGRTAVGDQGMASAPTQILFISKNFAAEEKAGGIRALAHVMDISQITQIYRVESAIAVHHNGAKIGNPILLLQELALLQKGRENKNQTDGEGNDYNLGDVFGGETDYKTDKAASYNQSHDPLQKDPNSIKVIKKTERLGDTVPAYQLALH